MNDFEQAALREQRIQSISQMVLAGVAIGISLYFLRSVLVPFVLSLFFVCGIVPVRDAIERRFNAPRALAVGITFVLGLIVGQILWALLWMSVGSLLDSSDDYKARFEELVDAASESAWARTIIGIPDPKEEKEEKTSNNESTTSLPNNTKSKDDEVPSAKVNKDTAASEKTNEEPGDDNATSESKSDGKGVDRSKGKDADESTGAENEKSEIENQTTERLEQARKQYAPPPLPEPSDASDFSDYMSKLVKHWLSYTANALMAILSNGLMVAIFMFFLLLGRSESQPGIWHEIESKIRKYIVTKTSISLFTGGAFGLVLWFYDVPLALLFGFLAFLLNFIPNVGPVVASLLPLPLIVLHPDLSTFSMVMVIVLSCGVQFVSGNILEPKIMGDSFELHPVAIMLALIFWGVLWGTTGMFLATPITAAIKILFEKFDRTKVLAQMMAGKMESAAETEQPA